MKETLTHLSDLELIGSFKELVLSEHELLVLQLDHLFELDRRKLFLHYSSLSSFLVHEHGMEEWLAERRIRAARLMKRIPGLRAGLESGKLNLTLLEHGQGCAHREKLSDEELSELLEAISGMTTRAAQREIATRYPETFELPKDRIRPLNEELSEVRFTAGQELLDKLDEIRGLLAHSHPGATLAELIDVLATEYRERHHPEEKTKRASQRAKAKVDLVAAKNSTEEVASPAAKRVKTREASKSEKRVLSQGVAHELVREKGYQCSFIDPITGKRCSSRWGLEKDHIRAWSLGGSTDLKNMRFLCKNHHRRVSFQQFGESARAREWDSLQAESPLKATMSSGDA